MSLNERMNKLKNKASLTAEELEQVTGGVTGGLDIQKFWQGKIKYDTPLYMHCNGSGQLTILEADTKVMVYQTANGFSRISSMNNARENLGYVEAGAVERLTSLSS